MKPRIFKWGGVWMQTFEAFPDFRVSELSIKAQAFCARLNRAGL